MPGGRLLTPLDASSSLGPGIRPAVSPNRQYVVTSNGGPDRYSLTLLDRTGRDWIVRQIETKRDGNEGGDEDERDWRSVFMGLAFKDDRTLYASEGNSAGAEIALPKGTANRVFELNQGEWKDSYSGDLAFDAERSLLYVVDQANFRVGVFNTRNGRLVASLRTGRLPFRVALSPDRRQLYVTNVGMFEYKPVPGADRKRARETGLPFPAFGFPRRNR